MTTWSAAGMKAGLTSTARAFAQDRSGATAVEYSMIAAGIAGAIIITIWTLGGTIQTNLYGKVLAAFGL